MIAPPRARSSSGLWNHPKAGRSSSPNQTGRALVTLSSWRGCCAFGACRAGSPVPPFASGVEAVAKPDMTSSEPSNVLGPPDLSAQLSRALRPSVSSPRRERLPYSPKKPYLWLRPAPSCAHADKVRGLNEEILEDLEATDRLHESSDVSACFRTSPVSTGKPRTRRACGVPLACTGPRTRGNLAVSLVSGCGQGQDPSRALYSRCPTGSPTARLLACEPGRKGMRTMTRASSSSGSGEGRDGKANDKESR